MHVYSKIPHEKKGKKKQTRKRNKQMIKKKKRKIICLAEKPTCKPTKTQKQFNLGTAFITNQQINPNHKIYDKIENQIIIIKKTSKQNYLGE